MPKFTKEKVDIFVYTHTRAHRDPLRRKMSLEKIFPTYPRKLRI